MRALLALALVIAAACGPASTLPAPTESSRSLPELKFAVMDAVGKPVYCDPDYYPIARDGGEQANALAFYPQIKSDTATYSAILAHEHLPSGDLTDEQKLVVYRAWKLLRAVSLVRDGNAYTFQYRTQPASGGYAMVAGSVTLSGAVQVTSRAAAGPPICPICLAASTLIATPAGSIRVTDVRTGTVVWSATADGRRVAEPVIAVGSTPVPPEHLMVHLVLADGRELLASPGHRTADGRALGSLRAGDSLDGSTVVTWELVPYAGGRTYDILPAGATGRYWADGIELSSTLKT